MLNIYIVGKKPCRLCISDVSGQFFDSVKSKAAGNTTLRTPDDDEV